MVAAEEEEDAGEGRLGMTSMTRAGAAAAAGGAAARGHRTGVARTEAVEAIALAETTATATATLIAGAAAAVEGTAAGAETATTAPGGAVEGDAAARARQPGLGAVAAEEAVEAAAVLARASRRTGAAIPSRALAARRRR